MNDFWRLSDLQERYLKREPTITKTEWLNGSLVSILTASQKSVRGPHPNFLILDEVDEMEYEIFEAALSQPLSKHNNPASIGIFSTNHNIGGTMDKALEMAESGGFQLYKYCIWECLESCRDYECSTCKLSSLCPGKHMKEANGYYKIVDFVSKLHQLSWDTLQREWFCEKVGRGDLVYQNEYDEDIHLVNVPFNSSKGVFLSVDWGGVNPFSVGVWQNFDTLGWVRIDEVYMGNTTNQNLLKECKERLWWNNIQEGIADPARADLIEEWRNEGITMIEADNSVEPGIEAVKAALRPVLGNPKIFFNRSCVNCRREFLSYKIKNGKIVKKNDHTCVVGNSIIHTVNGDIPIKDLVGKEGYVYSYNGERICVKKFFDVRKTGLEKEVWKLFFKDGSSLIATPDHKIMLRDGNYKQLKELKYNDSIMPLYKSNNFIGHVDIRLNKNGLSLSAHRLVWQDIIGEKLLDGEHIHHKNKDPSDNHPTNLMKVTLSEHCIIHKPHLFVTEKGKQIQKGVLKKQWLNKEFRENGIKHLDEIRPKGNTHHTKDKKYWTKDRLAMYSQVIKQGFANSRVNKECLVCYRNYKGLKHQRFCSGGCKGKASLRLSKGLPIDYIFSNRSFHLVYKNNHKVQKVEFYGYSDVYNMEVQDTHNFACNEIIVHNCDEIRYMVKTKIAVTELIPTFDFSKGKSAEKEEVSSLITKLRTMSNEIRIPINVGFRGNP